jgi:Na+-driven multidrug efflux pump
LAILLNILFNWTLMFGKLGLPQLGLNGAAWGTVISRTVEMVILVVFTVLLKFPFVAKIKKMLSFSKDYVAKYFRMLAPVFINEVLWVVGISVYTVVFGRLPDSAAVLAGVNVTQTLDKLIGVMIIGVGIACSVLIGNTLGSGDTELAQDYAKKSLQFSVVLGLIVGGAMFALSYLAPALFRNISPESQKIAADLMRVFAMAQVFRALNFTMIIGILRPGGDTLFCMLLETLTMWTIAVPLCFIGGFVLHLEVHWIYAIVFMELVVKCILAFVRYRKNRWVKTIA